MIQPHSAVEDGPSRDEAACVSTTMYGKLPETRLCVKDVLHSIKSPRKTNGGKESGKEERKAKNRLVRAR